MLSKLFYFRRTKAVLFGVIDCLFPKRKNKILFVIKNRTCFSGNLRVVLDTYIERSKSDNLYVYKDGPFKEEIKKELKERGVTVLNGFNLYSIWHILTSGVMIFSHNPRDAHITKKCNERLIINLWHGVAIKQIELLMPSIDTKKLKLLHNNSRLYDMVIASSNEDKKTNAKAFGIALDKVKVTGLPRYEILKNRYKLSPYLNKEALLIEKVKNGRKLILFAPTFREKNISSIEQITRDEWRVLEEFAKEKNILFGVRPHPYDIKSLPSCIKNSSYFHLFDNLTFTEPNILLRYTDLLIVDFSSIWVDYLLLHRPILGFAKDFDHYLKTERGFTYDFHTIFPSVFLNNIEELIKHLKDTLLYSDNHIEYKDALSFFHKYSLEDDYPTYVYTAIEELRLSGSKN